MLQARRRVLHGGVMDFTCPEMNFTWGRIGVNGMIFRGLEWFEWLWGVEVKKGGCYRTIPVSGTGKGKFLESTYLEMLKCYVLGCMLSWTGAFMWPWMGWKLLIWFCVCHFLFLETKKVTQEKSRQTRWLRPFYAHSYYFKGCLWMQAFAIPRPLFHWGLVLFVWALVMSGANG